MFRRGSRGKARHCLACCGSARQAGLRRGRLGGAYRGRASRGKSGHGEFRRGSPGGLWLGKGWVGADGQGRLGGASQRWSRCGGAGMVLARQEWLGRVWHVGSWSRKARHVVSRQGLAWCGEVWPARWGSVRSGPSRPVQAGRAGFVVARLAEARLVVAVRARQCWAVHVQVRRGSARQGRSSWLGVAALAWRRWPGGVWRGRHVKVGFGGIRHVRACPGEARSGKAAASWFVESC